MLPALVGSAIVGALASAAVSLVGRVLLALGIGYVSYTGFSALFSSLFGLLSSHVAQIPADLSNWFGVLQIQTSINIITAAHTTRLALVTTTGVVKKMVVK